MPTEIGIADSAAAIIASFAVEPFRASRELRQLLVLDPVGFCDAVMPLVGEEVFTAGHRHALTLLVSQGFVFDRLLDRNSMPKNTARRLVQRIDSLDATLVASMAMEVLRGHGPDNIVRNTAAMSHVLELLEHTTGAHRATPLLNQLLRHPEKRIRAKVTLLLGKINHNLKWAEERLHDTDPRVRASAVEAMWGVNTPEALRVFDLAVQDPHGRVAVNAALGMYRLGELSAPDYLIQMLAATDPMRRAGAAWGMGQTGDPRFVPVLSSALRDTDLTVRKNVFQALSSIRLRVERCAKEYPLEVLVTNVDTWGGVRQLEIAILSCDSQPESKVRPLNLVIRDTGRVLHRLTVTERNRPESTSVAFVVPVDISGEQRLGPALTKAFQVFLPYKRKSDAWSALRYSALSPSKSEAQRQEAKLPDTTGTFQLFRMYMPETDTSAATPASAPVKDKPGAPTGDKKPAGTGTNPPSPAAPELTMDPGPRQVRFALDASALLAVSECAGAIASAADNLHDALASLIGSTAFSPGARYIFIVVPASSTPPSSDFLKDAPGLAQRAKDARVQISAMVIGANRYPVIDELCRGTRGISVTVASEEDLPEASIRVAARLMSFYTVEYEAPGDSASQLSVQVITEQGFGKDELGEQRFH